MAYLAAIVGRFSRYPCRRGGFRLLAWVFSQICQWGSGWTSKGPGYDAFLEQVFGGYRRRGNRRDGGTTGGGPERRQTPTRKSRRRTGWPGRNDGSSPDGSARDRRKGARST